MKRIIELQDELIQLLEGQIADLTIMSKIELGNDVIWKIHGIKNELKEAISETNTTSNNSGDIPWWVANTSDNPGVNNDNLPVTKSMDEIKTHVTKSMGETTIEFPKQHKPEPYNPNRGQLDTMSFKFYQDENCVDGGEGEELIVEAKSSLGIDGDGGAFYVLKTNQWAISDINELSELMKRVERAVMATNPTSVHV